MSSSSAEAEYWWFNLKTGQAEFGRKSKALDRVGPFDTEKEALAAPALLAARTKAWVTEEEND